MYKASTFLTKGKLFRTLALSAAAVSSVAVLSSASVSAMGYNRGFSGRNDFRVRTEQRLNVRNTNNVNIHNNVTQTATSGDVSVYRNKWVGDVSSGDATNVSNNSFNVDIRNNTSF
jgi:hypothetical protein